MVVGVPEEKAVAVALGLIAQRARGALIDAAAAYREQNSQVGLMRWETLACMAWDSSSSLLLPLHALNQGSLESCWHDQSHKSALSTTKTSMAGNTIVA